MFSLNMITMTSFAWLLKAYWPMDRPPSAWNVVLLTNFLSSASVFVADTLFILGVLSLAEYSTYRSLAARVILASGGYYAVSWHLRRSRGSDV
jgi:hypothetical protein